MKEPGEILVTHALPYANPLHIGHLLAKHPVRYSRVRGAAGDKVHLAADDAYGTLIMLAAERPMTPEEFIRGYRSVTSAISLISAWLTTTTTHFIRPRTANWPNSYARLRDAKPSHIATRSVRQFDDPVSRCSRRPLHQGRVPNSAPRTSAATTARIAARSACTDRLRTASSFPRDAGAARLGALFFGSATSRRCCATGWRAS